MAESPVRLAEKYTPFSLPLPVEHGTTQPAWTTVANVILQSAERFSAICIILAGLYTCLRLLHTDSNRLATE